MTAKKNNDRYVHGMRLLAAGYFLFGLGVFFFNSQILYLVNFIPQVLNLFDVTPDVPGSFWVIPAAVLMLTLSALCVGASFHPRNASFFWIHLFSKLISATAFLTLFFYRQKVFAYVLFGGLEIALSFYLTWTSLRLFFSRREADEPTLTDTQVPTDPHPSLGDSEPNVG